MDWFRMYGEMIDDPKIGTLDDAAFRTWVELLCAACKAEDNGNTHLKQADLDWVFRRNASVTLQKLLQRELITVDVTEDISITKWQQRQKKSDSSAGRVRAHRAKAKQDKDSEECNATETLQKRDSNGLEKRREEKKDKEPSARKAKISLPANFGISERVQAWAKENNHAQLEAHLSHFVGYARANGKTYADWDQAFMNAIRDNWAKLQVPVSGGAQDRFAGAK